jgi:hypothetical protein
MTLRSLTLRLLPLRLSMLPLLGLALAATLALTGPAFADGSDARTALVIGNAAYSFAPLTNPVNDATDVAAALRQAGFDVMLKTDGDQHDMQGLVQAFTAKLRQLHGVGLFYFAGHGMQVNGENYILPIMKGEPTDDALKSSAVGAADVVDAMADAHDGLNIVILDACRDNPMAHSGTRGLSRIDTNASLFVSYSTSPGLVALDGAGRNSPYSKNLVASLEGSDLSIEETFKRTLKGVYQETQGRQTPWISSSFFGDFTFHSTNSATREIDLARSWAPAALSGVYRVTGVNPNGTRYQGMLTLTPFGKDYLFRWWINRQAFTGSGRFAGRMLVVDWGDASPVVYTIKRDASLDGEWADGSATERLELMAQAAASPVAPPSGNYRVSGRNPNGDHYTGTVAVAGQAGQYVVDWHVGTSRYRGTGAFANNVFTVDWGDASPVVYAARADGTFVGLWKSGAGEETLTPER